MPPDLAEQEKAVRPLLELGWSERKIADATDLSQPTVHRAATRIKTGPNPIQTPKEQTSHRAPALLPIALAVLGLLLLAVAAASFTMLRAAHRPQAAPAIIRACVRVSAAGAITGIAPAHVQRCPAGWKPLILTSSR